MTKVAGARRWVRWTAYAAVLVAIIVLIEPVDAPKPTPEEEAARAAAQKFRMSMIRCENGLEDRLADPSGYRVDPESEWRVVGGGGDDDRTFTFGFVARNAFGALVASEARCRVIYRDGHWRVEEMTVSP